MAMVLTRMNIRVTQSAHNAVPQTVIEAAEAAM